jgi:ABC-type cobalamin/Fe3+-siderophores transport system ATPase subunit
MDRRQVVVQNKITAILGRKGSGKSRMLRDLLGKEPRIVLWDVLGEHNWCPNRIADLAQLDGFFSWTRKREKFAARFVPLNALESTFDPVCDMVYRRGHLAFGVEEVAMISQPNWLPEGFDKMVRLGRHRVVDILWTSQRAGEVARRLTAQTDVFIIFRHTEPRDLDAIADRCGSEVRDQVSQLREHDHLVWNVETGAVENAELPAIRA